MASVARRRRVSFRSSGGTTPCACMVFALVVVIELAPAIQVLMTPPAVIIFPLQYFPADKWLDASHPSLTLPAKPLPPSPPRSCIVDVFTLDEGQSQNP